jgi:hypothetical protein
LLTCVDMVTPLLCGLRRIEGGVKPGPYAPHRRPRPAGGWQATAAVRAPVTRARLASHPLASHFPVMMGPISHATGQHSTVSGGFLQPGITARTCSHRVPRHGVGCDNRLHRLFACPWLWMSVAWYRSRKGAIRDSPPQGPTDGPEPHHTLSLAYLEGALSVLFLPRVHTTLTRCSLNPYAQHYKRPYKATLGLGGDHACALSSSSCSCEEC